MATEPRPTFALRQPQPTRPQDIPAPPQVTDFESMQRAMQFHNSHLMQVMRPQIIKRTPGT